MNDHFLNNLRKSPSKEFSNQLFAEINSVAPNKRNESTFWARKWVIGFTSLAFLVAIAMFVPPVKAFTVDFLKKAGILTVEEIDQVTIPFNQDEVMSIGISEQEARTSFPVVFNLPTWVPESYSLDPQFSKWVAQGNAQGTETQPYVNIQWESERGFIRLVIYQYNEEMAVWYQEHPEKVGLGSAKEIYINGNPAALITGRWESTSTSDKDDTSPLFWSTAPGQGSLIWVQDELFFIMYWGSASENASPLQNDEIIRMAESIP